MTDQNTHHAECASRSNAGLGRIIICRDGDPTEYGAQFIAVDENGGVVSEHFCSSNSWARRDLISPGHDCHVEKYTTRYPHGYELIDLVDAEYLTLFPNVELRGRAL